VHAIDAASPLPAPPDPDVFSRIVHLGFTAEAYAAGRNEDQYEPEMLARAALTHAITDPPPQSNPAATEAATQ
jgi:hypothetical protein